jgi:serine/threonine protein kinase
MESGILTAIIVTIVAILVMIVAYFIWRWRRAKNDEAWQVKVEELHFGQHAEVIGQGSFGVVLLAEYRGTKVAIKRVLPLPKSISGSMSSMEKSKGTKDKLQHIPQHRKQTETVDMCGVVTPVGEKPKDVSSSIDIEAQKTRGTHSGSNIDPYRSASSAGLSGSDCSTDAGSDDGELSFLGHLSYGRSHGVFAKLFPWLFPDNETAYNASILGTASGGSTTRTVVSYICPCFDANYKRQQEFMEEMRLLSRLRHPCKSLVLLE